MSRAANEGSSTPPAAEVPERLARLRDNLARATHGGVAAPDPARAHAVPLTPKPASPRPTKKPNLQAPARRPLSGAAARRPVVAARRSSVAVRASAEVATEVVFCEPKDVRKLVDDRGYLVIDLRMYEENAEASKWWWKSLPLFAQTRAGDVVRNPQFPAMFQAAFPNKMSRAILVCDETHERSELVWEEFVAPGGYTAMKVLKGEYACGYHDLLEKIRRAAGGEHTKRAALRGLAKTGAPGLTPHHRSPFISLQQTGGAEGYFEYEPLDEKDTRPKWRLTGQTSGELSMLDGFSPGSCSAARTPTHPPPPSSKQQHTGVRYAYADGEGDDSA
jgi:hypothetical protein